MNEEKVTQLLKRIVEDMELNSRGFTRLEQSRMDYSRLAREVVEGKEAFNEMAAELWVKVYAESILIRTAPDSEILADSSVKRFRERFQTDKTAGATSAPVNQGGQTV